MQHSKSYIISQNTEQALDLLYKEIQHLERKAETRFEDLKRKIKDIKNNIF